MPETLAIPEVTFNEFFVPPGATAPRFDPDYEELLKRIIADPERKFDKLVLLECHLVDSSWFGAREVLLVGPECTYKTIEELHGQHIPARAPDGSRPDLASNQLWPVCWTRRPGLEPTNT